MREIVEGCDWEDEDETEIWEEEITPETCPMGMFSPGTEQCDFCPWKRNLR